MYIYTNRNILLKLLQLGTNTNMTKLNFKNFHIAVKALQGTLTNKYIMYRLTKLSANSVMKFCIW